MSFDSKNPPVWLRKLHANSAQVSPSDYSATPEEGLLSCCRLSDAVIAWSLACAEALDLSPASASAPLDHPFAMERRGIGDVVR
jgi:hypothetical protein